MEKVIIKENLGIETGTSYVVFQLLENEATENIDFRLVAIFDYQVDANEYVKNCPKNCIYIEKFIKDKRATLASDPLQRRGKRERLRHSPTLIFKNSHAVGVNAL